MSYFKFIPELLKKMLSACLSTRRAPFSHGAFVQTFSFAPEFYDKIPGFCGSCENSSKCRYPGEGLPGYKSVIRRKKSSLANDVDV